MPEFIDCQQNSPEWEELRLGRITSSKAGAIMANYGKAFGDPAKRYALELAVERLTGRSASSGYSNAHMERGHEQEPLARELYQDQLFCAVDNGGFFFTETEGASPDGRVLSEGIIEIKSVMPHVHAANVKRRDIDPAYKWQCYRSLKFVGCEWLDFISFCAVYPENGQLFVKRIYASDLSEEFAMIEDRLSEFEGLVCAAMERINSSEYMLLEGK